MWLPELAWCSGGPRSSQLTAPPLRRRELLSPQQCEHKWWAGCSWPKSGPASVPRPGSMGRWGQGWAPSKHVGAVWQEQFSQRKIRALCPDAQEHTVGRQEPAQIVACQWLIKAFFSLTPDCAPQNPICPFLAVAAPARGTALISSDPSTWQGSRLRHWRLSPGHTAPRWSRDRHPAPALSSVTWWAGSA